MIGCLHLETLSLHATSIVTLDILSQHVSLQHYNIGSFCRQSLGLSLVGFSVAECKPRYIPRKIITDGDDLSVILIWRTYAIWSQSKRILLVLGIAWMVSPLQICLKRSLLYDDHRRYSSSPIYTLYRFSQSH